VPRPVDERRILWAAGDIVENRPALSRWHPDYADAFAKYGRALAAIGVSPSATRALGRADPRITPRKLPRLKVESLSASTSAHRVIPKRPFRNWLSGVQLTEYLALRTAPRERK
jgi:hypothetical protein